MRWVRSHPQAVAVAGMVLAGFALRFPAYTRTSLLSNADELDWAWVGQSLLAPGHDPTGWSKLSAYTSPVSFPAFGTSFRLVSHYLDHPPVFALLVGGVASVFGEVTRTAVTAGVIRLVPIALSVPTMLLGWALARRLAGRQAGLVAAGLLALSPWAIAESHLTESEALLTPMFLGALLLSHRLARGDAGRWDLPALVALCTLAPLVKVPGVAVGASCCALLLLAPGRRRYGLAALVGTAAGVAAFAAYGAAVDWSQFVATLHSQAGRRGTLPTAEALALLTSTNAGLGGHVPLLDPLWFAGVAALIVLAVLPMHRREHAFVVIPFAVYVVLMGLIADPGSTENSGWYRFPVVPLVYIALAICLDAAWREASLRLSAGAGRVPSSAA